MEKLILSSNNKHKIEEFRAMLPDIEILSLSDIGFFDDIVEDGKTFEENALIKSRTIHNWLKKQNKNFWVVSDDSGLCVKALNDEPGVYSARYGGDHNDDANRKKLLDNLKGKKNRDAYFMCKLALISPEGEEIIFSGTTEGKILTKETGTLGMCYDRVFYSYDLNECFAVCSPEEKNSVSHRFRAIQQLKQYFNTKKVR